MVTKADAQNRCKAYLEHLHEVFSFLVTYGRVQIDTPQMYHSCATSESRLASDRRKKGPASFSLSIEPNWEIPISPSPIHGIRGDASLIVGGTVSAGRGPTVQQSIVIALLLQASEKITLPNSNQAEALEKGDRVLIRRFHFDYDTTLKSPKYPRSHLQYGGKHSGHIDLSDVQYRLYSVDVPRIPFPPFDLVLVLDFFLRQFQTPLADMVEEARWLNLVRVSERLWLGGYFQQIASHLDQKGRTETYYKHISEHVDWCSQ